MPWSHSSTTHVLSMVGSTVSQASGPGLSSRGHSWCSTAGSSGCALQMGRTGGSVGVESLSHDGMGIMCVWLPVSQHGAQGRVDAC